MLGHRVVCIELKRVRGSTTSPEQKAWINTLNSAGVETVVAKGAGEAIEFIERHLPRGRVEF